MFRFHDAIEPSFHSAVLSFSGRKGKNRRVTSNESFSSEESEHIFDNQYTPYPLSIMGEPALGKGKDAPGPNCPEVL